MIQTPLINIMTAAVKKAAIPIIRDFNEVENLQISPKGTDNFTQFAQNRTANIITRELEKIRPGYQTIIKNQDQITGTDKSHKWIINPINGSENFARAIPHFTITLTLERENQIIATVIHNPITNETFIAEKNKGAWLNGKRIKVSKKDNIKNATIAVNQPKIQNAETQKFSDQIMNLRQHARNIRNMGALTLESAFLAAGKIDALIYKGENIWNSAAAQIIITEAGGIIQDINQINQNPIKTGNIIAANIAMPDIRQYLQATDNIAPNTE